MIIIWGADKGNLSVRIISGWTRFTFPIYWIIRVRIIIVAFSPSYLNLRHVLVYGIWIERNAVIPGVKANFQSIRSIGYTKTTTVNKPIGRYVQETKGESVSTGSVIHAKIEFCNPFIAHGKIDRLIVK